MCAKGDADAARYVLALGRHRQSMIDTGACWACAQASTRCSADTETAIAGFAKLARQHRNTGGEIASRGHLAAACAADAVRVQARRNMPPLLPSVHATRLRRLRNETLALQFGGATGTLAALGDRGLAVAGTAGGRTQAAAAGGALAHPSRPHRGSGVRVRHSRRHQRQDRPRRSADDADRRRGSLRAIRRRPRRLFHHAAQAQSGGGRGGPWRRHHGAGLAATMFAAQIQRRAQRRALARGVADLTGAHAGHFGGAVPLSSISPKGWKSMRRGCASISTRPAG